MSEKEKAKKEENIDEDVPLICVEYDKVFKKLLKMSKDK